MSKTFDNVSREALSIKLPRY